MKGFKDFLMRGNLIELAVAFIMGAVFAAVVSTFTDLMLDVVGLLLPLVNALRGRPVEAERWLSPNLGYDPDE